MIDIVIATAICYCLYSSSSSFSRCVAFISGMSSSLLTINKHQYEQFNYDHYEIRFHFWVFDEVRSIMSLFLGHLTYFSLSF